MADKTLVYFDECEPPALERSDPTLGELLSAALGGPSPFDLETQFFDWLSDAIAAHYRLHRDDVADKLLDLEVEYAERNGDFNFGHMLHTTWGIATIAAAVAEQVTGQEVTAPPLMLSVH